MDWATILDFLIKGVLAISQFALFVYVRNANRNDKVDEEFGKIRRDQKADSEKHSGEINALSGRMAHLETAIATAPNHDDFGKVYVAISDLARTVNQLVGENRGQSDTLRLIMNRITEKGMP